MAMVRRVIDFDNFHFSEESLARMEKLDDWPIDYSDNPDQTIEEMREGHRLALEIRRKQKKQMFSLRLENSTVEWWKSLGNGYTTVMAKFLDKAKEHPEWVKMCL